MKIIESIPVDNQHITKLALAATPALPIIGAEKDKLIKRIKALLKEKNAVLVAHYYTDEDLQILADET